MDPLVLMTEVDRATQRLLRTAEGLDDAGVAAPSGLPGWTRGHVLTHVARNADAYANLLRGAATGADVPGYASPEARAEGIEAGHARPLAEQLADIRAAHERFAEQAAAVPAGAWPRVLQATGHPAAMVPWARLREVEVHHADLAAGYTPAHWPEAFALRLLREVLDGLHEGPPLVLRPDALGHPLVVGDPAAAPVVSGPAWALAAWLTGRGDGAALTVSPDGELPTPPRWK
ncbi:maleylpyruvate isomerase [Spirilliplanes yamanashiensis]|nr:maleylpyruvate isomerase [Spirilliplanes yamanashiensis]